MRGPAAANFTSPLDGPGLVENDVHRNTQSRPRLHKSCVGLI